MRAGDHSNGLRITYLPQMPEFPQGASVLDYVAEGSGRRTGVLRARQGMF